MDFSLPRSNILRSRKDIESLLTDGSTVLRHPVKARWKVNAAGQPSRMMVSVPKRHFKRAVKRNLLKRRIREAFRLNRALLGEKTCDILFIYTGKEIEDYAAIEERIKAILAAIAAK